MTDQLETWRQRLAGEDPPVGERPDAGCYRLRTRNKAGTVFRKAVLYWWNGDKLQCWIDGKIIQDELYVLDKWMWARTDPISRETYDAYIAGKGWPDVDEALNERAVTGHNSEPGTPETPEAALQRKIEIAACGADRYAVITTADNLARAQTLRSALLEMKGQAKKTFDRLKEPHWTNYTDIREVWLPLEKLAEAAANTIRTSMEVYLKQERDKATATQRAADAAAATAAAEAAKAGAPPPPPRPSMPAPITQIKGGSGRAASARVKVVVVITDQDAVYQALRAEPEVVDLLTKIAQRWLDGGRPLPGTTTDEGVKVT
jgi:hypothetical protein